jgi:ABC-2 type transport system ATP-binding protein
MIRVENLTKSFGSTVAVNNVTLSIRKGELFGLLGPNGAGKSTLINMLTGLLRQDSGTVAFTGYDRVRQAKEIRRLIGFVPQDMAFYLNYSAMENVRFFASLYGLKGKALSAAATAALEVAGLGECGRKPAKTFSGGMKRRLNIACGIAHDPEIIILDEPTVGIDPQSRNHILRSVENLKRQGRTVVYTTHYMEEAENICSEIAIMDKGKIIALGTQEQLKLLIKDSCRVCFHFKRPETVDLPAFEKIAGVRQVETEDLSLKITSEVGISNLNLLTAEVNRQELMITDIKSDSPSLETVFLNLTGRSLRD